MKVRNRDGQSVEISYNEIRDRIVRLLKTEQEHRDVDVDRVVITTVNGIYDGITTSELDELSARVCADLQGVHYMYDVLAARILASNWQKNARRVLAGAGGIEPTFSGKTAYMAWHLGTVSAGYAAFVAAHSKELDAMVDYGRDDGHTYFALRTLERSYLAKAKAHGAGVIESPQDMWMRVAVAIHMPQGAAGDADSHDDEDVLERIARCYDAMSSGMFTHATPTLFNAGTKHQQCSSCYLLGTDDRWAPIMCCHWGSKPPWGSCLRSWPRPCSLRRPPPPRPAATRPTPAPRCLYRRLPQPERHLQDHLGRGPDQQVGGRHRGARVQRAREGVAHPHDQRRVGRHHPHAQGARHRARPGRGISWWRVGLLVTHGMASWPTHTGI